MSQLRWQRGQALSKSSPLQSGEGLSGTVVSTGKSALIPHIDQATFASRAPSAYRDFLERFPTYAVMIAPLRVRGRVIGTMATTRIRDGLSYSDADLEMLEGLADRAAGAIEASRLYKATEDAKARAEQLYQFAHAAVSADRVEHVFEAALTAIGNSLKTGRSAILLFDDDGVMRFRASRGLSEDYRRAVEGHTPWPRDANAPQPVLVPDVMADVSLASYGELFRRERIGSLAFIPIVSRGALLGKFMVYYEQAHSYSPNEIELAGTIANHLGPILARFSAVGELEKTIRFNELFAGVLAHDLRNPLASMMMASQVMLMRQEGQGDPNAKPLSKILASGQRMSVMIDQLLDFTRSRVGGGIQIERVATNLADLCRQAVSELEIVHPDRKYECSYLGDNDGSWDADRLLQVISNLVANASQHGRADAPIRVTVDGRASDAVWFEIQNKGTIPPSLLQTVFDPFRGTNHRHGSRGLGLGLFIVKEIVRAHGGTVQVSSTDEAGTTFTVRLPR
ncbi:MAG: GAF domain-containing protein [Myxococcota bacterium]|nr:GAF domain-containing protein [Myxococcota bacterium]